MGKIQAYKNVVSAFISSEKGQRFFNFAYSIGAAIVIWGALFKILHLPGGNTLLSIGMGTEVLMFVLTAFDRPPREYNWEDVFPALRQHEEGEATDEPIAQINYGPAAGAYPGVPAAAPGASRERHTRHRPRRERRPHPLRKHSQDVGRRRASFGDGRAAPRPRSSTSSR